MEYVGIPERIVDKSSLTRRQLEILTSYVRVSVGELKLREAANQASENRSKGDPTKPVSVGSYYRSVAQARENIKESLVTLVIASWLGAIKLEDLRRLFDLMGNGPHDLSDEESERFVSVLEALLRRVIV